MKYALHATAFIATLASSALAQQVPPRNYAQQTAGLERHDGFIPFYFDERSGKLLFEVNRLDQDFLYLYSLSTGLGSNDRGLDAARHSNRLLRESGLIPHTTTRTSFPGVPAFRSCPPFPFTSVE